MEKLLRGAPVATALEEKLKTETAKLRAQGITPRLAIVRTGAQEGDLAYQRSIEHRAERLGVETVCFSLPDDCTQQALLDVISRINSDGFIHGCLLLRPLPKQINERAVCDALQPEKDMDCVSTGALARVFTGDAPVPPCTAQACVELLDFYGINPEGKRVTVVGRSLVIGKPVAMLLLARNATVMLCHSRTPDLPARCREADILIAAAGKAGLIGADCLRPGQIVLDVGIHTAPDGTLCGDVRFAEAAPIVQAITPVPGGVGSVTTTLLLSHVIEAAQGLANSPDLFRKL